jgi:hypothetical protein
MADSNKIPNPSNYQDSQNFNIDIDTLYNDFIKEIDASRSIVNISNQGNQAFLNNLKKETIASLIKLVKVESTPQESRCHTFFRLIGFPVVSKDFDFYNPGFDITNMESQGLSKSITLDHKITIANNSIDGFRLLSLFRENYVNRFLKTFSQKSSITASALALSSSTDTRSFAVPVQNTDPFDVAPASQTYVTALKSQVGQLNQALLLDYSDDQGNKPDSSQLLSDRFHFIKPFAVDARIDFTVAPSSRKIAVPFVFDKSNLLISENTFVKRPLIEKIIRERLASQDQSATLGSADQSIRDYILNTSSVKDEDIIKQMTSNNSIYNLSEQQQFSKYLHIIGAMSIKLVDAQQKMQEAQSLYYWAPIPSLTGPEGGSSVRSIIISEQFPQELLTSADRALIDLFLKKTANNFNAQTANVTGTADLGNFALSPFTASFGPDTTTSLGDAVGESVAFLNEKRNQHLTQANDSLRTVEIIMGEFSGFGFCDIIAIMGALYIMPIEDLLGFLDTDAFARMIKVLNLKENPSRTDDMEDAMTSLVQRVKDFYNLMDAFYQDVLKNNNTTT